MGLAIPEEIDERAQMDYYAVEMIISLSKYDWKCQLKKKRLII